MLIGKVENYEVYLPENFQEYKKISIWGEHFDDINENQFYIFKSKEKTFGYSFYSHIIADDKNCIIDPEIFLKDKLSIKSFIESRFEEMNILTLKIFKNLIQAKKPNYEKLKNSIVSVIKTEEDVDINFIIPARGRVDFSKSIFESFEAAKKECNKKICFTFVEHANYPQHGKYFKNKDANYFFISCGEKDAFNKCLAYNVGAMFGPKAKHMVFHDLDIVVKKDFFNNILANLEDTDSAAIQCYSDRRVLFCDEDLSQRVINNEFNVEDLNLDVPGVSLPMNEGKVSTGSKGGSIMVSNEMFKKVGGFDPELFEGYSSEDQFFWDKLEQFQPVSYADSPKVEIFHLWHKPMHGDAVKSLIVEGRFKSFFRLSPEEKKEFINLKSNLLNGNI